MRTSFLSAQTQPVHIWRQVFLNSPMIEEDDADSMVAFCGGSAGVSLYVRQVNSSLYAPSPFSLKAETQNVYSVYSLRSVRWYWRATPTSTSWSLEKSP